MSRSMTPLTSALHSLLRSQQTATTGQQCRRLLSTTQSTVSRRPIASSLQQQQQCLRSRAPRTPRTLEQRRFKSQTVEEAKSRYRTGPFSWKAGVLFVLTSGGLVWYFEHEKQRMQRKRIAEATKGVGRPKVGGEFELVDQNGKPFTSADMQGRYSLVSLVFPHLPACVGSGPLACVKEGG